MRWSWTKFAVALGLAVFCVFLGFSAQQTGTKFGSASFHDAMSVGEIVAFVSLVVYLLYRSRQQRPPVD